MQVEGSSMVEGVLLALEKVAGTSVVEGLNGLGDAGQEGEGEHVPSSSAWVEVVRRV
jgi:hypothetical protein